MKVHIDLEVPQLNSKEKAAIAFQYGKDQSTFFGRLAWGFRLLRRVIELIFNPKRQLKLSTNIHPFPNRLERPMTTSAWARMDAAERKKRTFSHSKEITEESKIASLIDRILN